MFWLVDYVSFVVGVIKKTKSKSTVWRFFSL